MAQPSPSPSPREDANYEIPLDMSVYQKPFVPDNFK